MQFAYENIDLNIELNIDLYDKINLNFDEGASLRTLLIAGYLEAQITMLESDRLISLDAQPE